MSQPPALDASTALRSIRSILSDEPQPEWLVTLPRGAFDSITITARFERPTRLKPAHILGLAEALLTQMADPQ